MLAQKPQAIVSLLILADTFGVHSIIVCIYHFIVQYLSPNNLKKC